MSDLMERVERALRLDQMRLPPVPRVVELRGAPYVDHLGDEELRVWIVLDDATTDQELLGRGMIEIREEIRRRLREEGIGRFAYTTVFKESEYSQAVGEDAGV